MDEVNRMVRSAVGMLEGVARGRGMLGIALDRKAPLTEGLLEATGCEIHIRNGLKVLLRDGIPVTSDRDPDRRMTERFVEWLSSGEDVSVPGRRAMPAGSDVIIEGMRLRMSRVLFLIEVLHYVFHSDGERTISIHRSSNGTSLTYRKGGRMWWRNGILCVRQGALPTSVGSALSGKPLSMLIDDPVIGDRMIRKVCDACPRDGILRIVTMDEGRRHIHQQD